MPGDYLPRSHFLLFILYDMEKKQVDICIKTASCKLKTLDENSETQFAKYLKIK